MTWKLKVRGAGGAMLAEYECPTHGRFDATVDRDGNGDPPSEVVCPFDSWSVAGGDKEYASYEAAAQVAIEAGYIDPATAHYETQRCGDFCPWVASAIRGRVKVGELDKGKVMDYPPENVCLDTRPLADGMPYAEWKSKQDKITRDINLKRSRSRDKSVLR
jgi:hypothetical protein